MPVLPDHADTDLHRHAVRLQKLNAAHRFCVPGLVTAQRLVGLSACAVQRNVHAARRIFRKKCRPVFIQKRAVRVHRNDHTALSHREIHRAKRGVQKRLAAREQQKQCACVA